MDEKMKNAYAQMEPLFGDSVTCHFHGHKKEKLLESNHPYSNIIRTPNAP